ncbi:MAG TPA: GntR family transcriptional regulator [Gemmatimonadales bacterium]
MTPRPAEKPRPVSPLARLTVAQATVVALRKRILAGSYSEGTPLRQDALAGELGVSRIPVREALRQLEVEGLVTFTPHRGAVVSSLSVADIEELFDLRALLESDMLRHAVPRLTAPDFTRADELLDRFQVALTAGDVADWGELNWQLHSTLYVAAGRPRALAIIENLHRHAERYMRMQLALTQGQTRANDEHRAVVSAARAGDAERAALLLTDHIRGAGRALVAFLRTTR